MAWSKEAIDKTVTEFRVALEAMAKDGHKTHAFDVGSDRDGQVWSLLVCLEKKELVDSIIDSLARGRGPISES
jgi:hypothetical protein